MQRKFVIPDIRGDITLLKKLIQKIGPTPDDQLIFTGSYIGPGPDSKGVVNYLIELSEALPGLALLRGCYEYLFGFCIETKPSVEFMNLWCKMGGNRVLQSYAAEGAVVIAKPSQNGNGKPKVIEVEMDLRIPASHIELFNRMPQWFEDDTYPYVVTHCGNHPALFGHTLFNELHTVFAENGWWLRDERQILGKTIIFSHQPMKEPFRRAGKLGLDLGAGFGGKLACFEFYEDKITIVE